MTIPVRLKDHLDQTHTFYVPIHHAPARSAQYAASLLHMPGKEVAKTVAMRAGKQVLLAVLPASYHINLAKLSAVLGAPVTPLGEQECFQLFPDCQHGAVPPFGEFYGLPVYLDETLAEAPEIVFSAGTLSDGIRMGTLISCIWQSLGSARSRKEATLEERPSYRMSFRPTGAGESDARQHSIPRFVVRHCVGTRTIWTEQGACRATASDTLPIRKRFRPFLPCDPTTTRSAGHSLAESIITTFGIPRSTAVVTANPASRRV